MRRVTVAVVLLAILATPVYAQGRGGRQDTPEEIQKKKEAEAVDQQYKSTLKRTNKDESTPVRTDPWANMRAPNESKR
jgi:hypothetical protein